MKYEYECQSCRTVTVIEHSIHESPAEDCPECGAPTLKRLVSGGLGFLLRGGGWAKDGYTGSGGQKCNESS